MLSPATCTYPGVPVLPPNFKKRMQTLEDIEDLERDLETHQSELQNRLAEIESQKAKLQADQRV